MEEPRIVKDADIPTAIVELALGRILRMGSRPAQPGDEEEFDRCRNIIRDTLHPLSDAPEDYVPNWVRDRMKGAAGD